MLVNLALVYCVHIFSLLIITHGILTSFRVDFDVNCTDFNLAEGPEFFFFFFTLTKESVKCLKSSGDFVGAKVVLLYLFLEMVLLFPLLGGFWASAAINAVL